MTNKQIQLYKDEFPGSVLRSLHDLAELAWNLGIVINSVSIQDSFVQELPYGGKVKLTAPKLTEISTPFMDFEVKNI